MKSSTSSMVTTLAIAPIAALGGALAVYAEYDDSPGGELIGLLLILGAMALGVRAARRMTTRWNASGAEADAAGS